MRTPTNSAVGTVARMRWPRPVVSSYCAQSGIRDVVSLLGRVLDKLSVDKLECWVWDQVYTLDAIPVLSPAMCMVIDVVCPVNGKRSHQNCWAGALIANILAALGVARLRVASQCAHPPRWACRVLRVLPPKWLPGISDPSCPLVLRIREACSVRFPANGFGTSVHVGKARLDRKRMCGMGPRAMEHLRALLYTNVRDGMKPRYWILRRSLGFVFMQLAVWCDSEVRALATEAGVDQAGVASVYVTWRTGSDQLLGNGARSRVRGNGHHRGFAGPGPRFVSVLKLCTPVSGPSWESSSQELLVLRCLSRTCTHCRSVKRLQKKVCWVLSTCLTGRELAS